MRPPSESRLALLQAWPTFQETNVQTETRNSTHTVCKMETNGLLGTRALVPALTKSSALLPRVLQLSSVAGGVFDILTVAE